jgi:hypothetical protein
VCDFKVISSYKQLVREIGGSAEQAEYCVVKMNYENKQSEQLIRSRVNKAMKDNPTIKGVMVLDKNGNVFYTTF